MRIVTRCLAVIVASLGLLPAVGAQEDSRPALVAVPSMQATLPDGTSVVAIIVIPAENVLNKNDAWQAWERQWPTRYRLSSPSPEPETPTP